MNKKSIKAGNGGGCGAFTPGCLIPFGITFGIMFVNNQIKLADYRANQKKEVADSTKIVKSCFGKEFCNGRIQALESLVKARKSLRDYDLSKADLNYANLSSANLSNANLSNVSLYEADLSNADLSNADLSNVDLSNVDLSGVKLIDVDLSGANLTNINLRHVDLNRVDISDANLTNTNLSGSDLTLTNLSGANFTNTNLSNAKLSFVNLNSAQLTGVDLSGANLWAANLNDTYFVETKNITSSQLKGTCNWQLAIYKVRQDGEEKNFVVDELANQEYIEKLKAEFSSFSNKPVDCSRWK